MNAKAPWFYGYVLGLIFLALNMVLWDVNPFWFRTVFGTALFVCLVIIVARYHIDRKRREKFGLQGRCSCGYDLQETPAKKTSRHSFDVKGGMSSTKKIVVCPECGKKQVLWRYDELPHE